MGKMFQTYSRLFAAVTGIVWLTTSAQAEEPLPPVEEVLQKMVQRAQSERPDASQDGRSYYLCTKKTVTEEMDSSGQIRNRKVKVRESRSNPSGAADANKWSSKNGINLNADLLRRYQFTLLRREMFNGRPTFLLTFVPRDPPPRVRQLQDYLLNRTVGTVWIDEADHELARAVIRLGQPVSFGILGAVESFHFSFERARASDGHWLTRFTDTKVKARKFLIPVQTRKRVDWTGFRKLD